MRQFFIFCFGLYVWLLGSGCGKPQSVDVWPRLRPLGADAAVRTKESPLFSPPKGTLTLPQVLALSMQHGPDLPVVVWAVRVGEAKIKQAIGQHAKHENMQNTQKHAKTRKTHGKYQISNCKTIKNIVRGTKMHVLQCFRLQNIVWAVKTFKNSGIPNN